MAIILAIIAISCFGYKSYDLYMYSRIESEMNQQHSDFLLSQLEKRKHVRH